MNRQLVSDWIGLSISMDEGLSPDVAIQSAYRVTDFVSAGETHAVFRVTGPDGEWVVKFPRTHIGFTIGVPPDQIFPEIGQDPNYPSRLTLRLQALQGSPMMSRIHPLDELWTALAVQHLADRDTSEQSVTLQEYDTLARCGFVRERLEDWATVEVGRSTDEACDILVIYQGEKAIHADLPVLLAQSASAAIAKLEDLSLPTESDVRNNPLLPWIAAGVSGYTIDDSAVHNCAVAIAGHANPVQAIKEAAQVWRYAVNPRRLTWTKTLVLLRFMFGVMDAAGVGSELRKCFLGTGSVFAGEG